MRIIRHNKLLIFLCFLIFVISSANLRAQYSRAEIDRAVNYLTERGILTGLVALTTQDRTKLTSRPDVLMACYEIMRELDSAEEQLLEKTSSIDQSVSEIRALTGKGGVAGVDYDALVERVMNELLKRYPNLRSSTNESMGILQTRTTQIEKELKSLKDALNKAAPDLTNAADINKRIKQNKIIAISAVAISVIATILAAR